MSGGRSWVVLGAGGHATSVAAILHRLGDRVAGHSDPGGTGVFADDASALAWAAANSAFAVPAVGSGEVRERMLAAARDAGVPTPPVVAQTAVVDPTASLGDGVVVAETAVVGPDSVVDTGAIVNTGAIVEHHACVGAFTHVAPRAVLLGAARAGARDLVGAGAVVLPQCVLGDDVTVGAGSVVTADVAAGDTVVGAPARRTSRDSRKADW